MKIVVVRVDGVLKERLIGNIITVSGFNFFTGVLPSWRIVTRVLKLVSLLVTIFENLIYIFRYTIFSPYILCNCAGI